MKEDVGKIVGKLVDTKGQEIPGEWEVYVYFNPNDKPLPDGTRRVGYIIGSASRVK